MQDRLSSWFTPVLAVKKAWIKARGKGISPLVNAYRAAESEYYFLFSTQS